MQGRVSKEQAVPLANSDSEEYEVDRVLASRVVRGGTEYLVRWKGYGSWEDSWEPAGNLEHAGGAIDLFLRSRGSRAR